MKSEEYVETLVIGNNLVVLGLDDAGQTYFFEYLDDNGELKEECCGSYNSNYIGYLEYKFLTPEKDCPYYEGQFLETDKNCDHKFSYGYCDKCRFQDIEWSKYQDLINLGIIDRRGNVCEKYSKYLSSVKVGDSN